MRHKSQERLNLNNLVIIYFKFRRLHNLYYIEYRVFKNLIKYITGITDPPYLRRIFEDLKKQKLISQIRIGKSTRYAFSPYGRPTQVIKDMSTVSFSLNLCCAGGAGFGLGVGGGVGGACCCSNNLDSRSCIFFNKSSFDLLFISRFWSVANNRASVASFF